MQALQHPYFKALHNPKYEPLCDTPFDFDFEKSGDMTKQQLQDHMFEEIYNFRPHLQHEDERGPRYTGSVVVPAGTANIVKEDDTKRPTV